MEYAGIIVFVIVIGFVYHTFFVREDK